MGADGAFGQKRCAVAGYDFRMAGCRVGFPPNLWRVYWRKNPDDPLTHAAMEPAGIADHIGRCLCGFSQGSHAGRSEEHTSELQSLMRLSYAVFCLKKKIIIKHSNQE